MQPPYREDTLLEDDPRIRPRGDAPTSAGTSPGRRRMPGNVPALTIGEALARYWPLVLVMTIAGVAGGIALGLTRKPVYTSEAELNAGSLSVQAQAIPGYVAATQTLAEAYARVVKTSQIEVPVAKRTGYSVGYVAAHLTAANIPDNPVFRIDGSGSSAAAAERLTAAATAAIIKYARTETTPPGAANALTTYKRQTAIASQLLSTVGRLKGRYPNPNPRQLAQISAARQAAAAAQLEATAAQQVYINATTSTTSAGSVILLSPAGPATSNRTRTAEIGGFGGAVVGCLVGSALAVWLAARRRRQVVKALLLDYENLT